MKLKNELKQIRWVNILMLTLAGIINAIGVVLFLSPVKLYDSGISGTSMLISQITPPQISLSVVLVILNIPLFLYGMKKQGILFTIYAIYTVSIYSVVAWLITDIIPIDVSITSPLAGNDLFLCALFGGIISGIGSGLAVRFGGAMDGIEVMAVIFAKRLGLTVGSFVMVYNVILYVICGMIISSWVLPLYSIVTYMAALKTIDFIVDGFDRAKAAMIVTKKPKEISKALSECFESGTTIIEATGGYSHNETAVVYFVINRFQIGKMKEIVHKVDPMAYITVNEVADIYRANQEKLS